MLTKIILSGLVLGILLISFNLSCATLLFSSAELKPYLPIAICSVFLSGIVLNLFNLFINKSYKNLYLTQTIYAFLGHILLSKMIHHMQEYPQADILATGMALIMCYVVITGVSMFLIGFFKWGKLINFIPYPVVSGFMAGQSILIISAGFFLTNIHVSSSTWALYLQADMWMKWIPAFLYSIVIFLIVRKYKHSMLFPALFLVFIVLFYVYLYASGVSIPNAVHSGLMLVDEKTNSSLLLIPILELFDGVVNWNYIFKVIPNLIGVSCLININMLFTISTINHMTYQRMLTNRQFKMVGLGNMLIGAMAGLGGYNSPVLTKCNYDFGLNNKWVPLILIFSSVFFLSIGTGFLAYCPRMVFGLLIIYSSYAAPFKI